jgi:uncharacterized membrane protein
MSDQQGHGRPRLTRAEQRYNYALAVGAVAIVVILIVVSPRIVLGGTEAPALLVAVLVGAFLFGLGQMLIGVSRRRAYLKSLEDRGTGR